MGLKLETKSKKTKETSREETEAQNILHELFHHDEGRGAISCLTLGMPGSVKTGLNLIFCTYAMNHYQEDKIFWRSSMNSPLQFMKLNKYKIYVEQDSGVHFYDRRTGLDITNNIDVQYFNNFDQLYNMCQPGICNAVFFKDLHIKGIENDYGTIQWFRYIRFLLGKFEWKHFFADEYHEMVKSGSSGSLWREIQNHSNDVSNSRKSFLSMNCNCHQTSEIDYRVLLNFMVTIQMYGSKPSKHTPVNRHALGHLNKPTEETGACGWVSYGGKFGKFNIDEVMKNNLGLSIMAKIVPSEEKTFHCTGCDHVALISDAFNTDFCSKSCYNRYTYAKNRQKQVISPSPQNFNLFPSLYDD